jgi:signal transduction histidine kinase
LATAAPSPNPVDDDLPAILVVDDHPPNLLALEAVLQPLGYRIVRASSGQEALRRLNDHDFVVVLMDVHMPDLDGYQTTALIRQRERCRDVPVIFLTAVYDDLEHTHRAYQLGAVDYLTKPFDPDVLRGKVRALVALYTRGQRAERERSDEAERLKDMFLGAVGHDLRGPLNVILLGAQLMAREGDCGKATHVAYVKKIERAGRRMQSIIEDILDLTRGQFAGGIPLSPQPTDLGEVCRVMLDEQRLAKRDRSLELDVSGDVCGMWDPDRLGRVVGNLLGNALEHGRGSPVRLSVRDHGEEVVLEVWNGGSPIEPETLGRVFEPFRRGDKSSGGLGLGLHIVREIVGAHGGSVGATSTVTDGTTFKVTLPRTHRPTPSTAMTAPD